MEHLECCWCQRKLIRGLPEPRQRTGNAFLAARVRRPAAEAGCGNRWPDAPLQGELGLLSEDCAFKLLLHIVAEFEAPQL